MLSQAGRRPGKGHCPVRALSRAGLGSWGRRGQSLPLDGTLGGIRRKGNK